MARKADYIRCRTYGHAWYEFSPGQMARPLFGFRLSLKCERCTTERHDLIDANGEVGSREYRYPDGYKDAFIDEKPTRAELRLMLRKETRGRRSA